MCATKRKSEKENLASKFSESDFGTTNDTKESNEKRKSSITSFTITANSKDAIDKIRKQILIDQDKIVSMSEIINEAIEYYLNNKYNS